MQSYLKVKKDNSLTSYEIQSGSNYYNITSHRPYLKINDGQLPLTTDTSNNKLNIYCRGDNYQVAQYGTRHTSTTYITTTSANALFNLAIQPDARNVFDVSKSVEGTNPLVRDFSIYLTYGTKTLPVPSAARCRGEQITSFDIEAGYGATTSRFAFSSKEYTMNDFFNQISVPVGGKIRFQYYNTAMERATGTYIYNTTSLLVNQVYDYQRDIIALNTHSYYLETQVFAGDGPRVVLNNTQSQFSFNPTTIESSKSKIITYKNNGSISEYISYSYKNTIETFCNRSTQDYLYCAGGIGNVRVPLGSMPGKNALHIIDDIGINYTYTVSITKHVYEPVKIY